MSSPALKAFIANESLGALPVNAFEIHSQKFELKWPSGGKELFGWIRSYKRYAWLRQPEYGTNRAAFLSSRLFE